MENIEEKHVPAVFRVEKRSRPTLGFGTDCLLEIITHNPSYLGHMAGEKVKEMVLYIFSIVICVVYMCQCVLNFQHSLTLHVKNGQKVRLT